MFSLGPSVHEGCGHVVPVIIFFFVLGPRTSPSPRTSPKKEKERKKRNSPRPSPRPTPSV